MEMADNAPPLQFNHNPCSWDHPPSHPPPNFEWRGPGFVGDGFHHDHRHNFPRGVDPHAGGNNQFPQFNGESFGGAHPPSKPHFIRKRKFDHYAKLFVGGITRTMTEEEIRHLFEEFGNVVEVVLLNDKRTGQQQEYCFVKYASREEAGRAISALHIQLTLPGSSGPLRVKYADGERERLACGAGLVHNDSTTSGSGTVHKLYVNGLNKEASKEEIMEIFSSYGVVVDVYMMRDQSRQNRGCGFVGFAHRFMAVAAINGLDGTYVMRGCDRPLAVRFADPKKPKIEEPRLASNSADVRGSSWSNASHPDNSSAVTQESTTDVHPIFSSVGKQLQCPASFEMEQPPFQEPFSPSNMPGKQSQTLQVNSQSSRQLDSQMQTSLLFNQTSTRDIEEQHDSECRNFVEPKSTALSCDPAPCALSGLGNDFPEEFIDCDCDWSEHICPDGHKYYFNCVTCESKWVKPVDFSLYEQQVLNLSHQEPHPSSTSETPSSDEGCQIQAADEQKQACGFEKPQLSISSALEHMHEHMQTETSGLGEVALSE